MRSVKSNARSSAGNGPHSYRKSSAPDSTQQTKVYENDGKDDWNEDSPIMGETLELSSSDQGNDSPEGFSIHEEEVDEKDFLFCEDCESFFFNKCEVHGLALFIPDTPVPMGIADRARKTLPPELEIQKSSIPGAGLGVFNKGKLIPLGTHFGPYQGQLVNREYAMNSGYSWVIYTSRQCENYIDARRELHANWMRYVNCARKNGEQNLEAFQYQGGILYRCCLPINPGQELLLWYDEKYASNLGPTFVYLWRKKCFANGVTRARLQISCSLCPLSYTSRVYLDKHIKRCHPEDSTRLQESEEIENEVQMFSKVSSQETSDPTLCSNKETRQPSSDSGRSSTRPRPYRCSKCAKSFISAAFLERHQRSHRGEPYQCSQCGKIFKRPWHLQNHLRTHTGDRPHLCTQCGKRFCTNFVLLHHLRIHTGEKPHLCPQCGKSFADRGVFRSHQLIHTGEKPYRCNQCDKSFAVWRYLRRHRRMHSDERPHRCSQCGKCFRHKSDLTQHRLIHSEVKLHFCGECGKSFTLRRSLKLHLLSHSGTMPHHCPECGKGFKQKVEFTRHLNVHSGKKPFRCSKCGKGYVDSRSLVRHKSFHSRKDAPLLTPKKDSKLAV